MDYSTALALKNAGFPPEKCSGVYKTTNVGKSTDSILMVPTLEEVIEEIGDDFQELKKYQMNSQWYATAFSQRTDAGEKIVIEGRTPLLAVVALYLALKQKKPH